MVDTWIAASSLEEPLLRFAIKGGDNSDGTPHYVGRCEHEGHMLPARVIPANKCAYVSWNGQDCVKQNYELLIGPGYDWVAAQSGNIPLDAVISGETKDDGESLYFGRAVHSGQLLMGAIKVGQQCFILHLDGQEINISSCEVLTRQPTDTWIPISEYQSGAVIVGPDFDGSTIYVARARHNDIMLPAKYLPDKRVAFVAGEGIENLKTDVELLVGSNYTWLQPLTNEVPPNIVITGRHRNGAPLCVGRVRLRGCLIPGLMSFERRCVIVPYRGRELGIINYDLLLRQ